MSTSTPTVQHPLLLSVSRETVAALCRTFGPQLKLAGTNDGGGREIDGARLLWAISGCESSFGQNCKPRFEPGYFTGGHYFNRSQAVRDAVAMWGRDASCSYGPWQLMAINAHGYTPEELGSTPEYACAATVRFLNSYILGSLKARTLSAILDSYNSGNWKDSNIPQKYVRDGCNYYQNTPLPAAK
jgi:hypothetical protein